MLLDKEVEVIIGSTMLKYYINLGYAISHKGEKIKIKVEHLSLGSKTILNVKCDICGTIKKLSYDKYNKNIKNTGIYSCNNSCSSFKNKQTNLIKYGFECALKNSIIKNKIEQTCIDTYGTKTPFSNENVKTKIKNTLFKNYGVTNPNKSDIVKEKIKKTNLERFGVEHNMHNKEVFEKNQISSCLLKTHDLTGLKYRGTYEKDFLDYCINNNISIESGMTIKYFFDNKAKVYYPDFYLKSLNLIIEIKSNYIYEKDLQKNLAKQKSCLDQGYNFIFIIDKKYETFSHLIQS